MQYRKRDTLCQLYEYSKRFVDEAIKEMEQTGRYPGDSILKGKGYIRVNEDDFRDFLRWREALRQGRRIPPYKRVETPEDLSVRRETR